MGRILVSSSHYDTICSDAKKYLEAKGHQVIFDPAREFPSYSKVELSLLLQDVDAAIVGMDIYDEEVFDFAPKLKAVAKFGVGVDNIDCHAAAEHGVYVINAPGQNSCSVAELCIGLIIDLLRGVVQYDSEVKQGRWFRHLGTELCGKTVGLVGFGAIARLLAERLKVFGTELLAYDLYPDFQAAEALGVHMCSLEEVLEKSDILSLHVPGLPSTHHIINRDSLAQMKNGAYLINTARGSLVDPEAVAEALTQGKLSGAALDVFEYEPVPTDAAILKCRNLICTPHIGGETESAYQKIAMSTACDIAKVLEGKEPKFCVNQTELSKIKAYRKG